MHPVLGAVIGAGAGAAAAAGKGYVSGEPVQWKAVVALALGGAVAGAIVASPLGKTPLGNEAKGKLGRYVAAGAAGGLVARGSFNVMDERPWHEGLAKSAVAGAAVGGVVAVAPAAAQKGFGYVKNTAFGRGAGAVWGRYVTALEKAPLTTKMATNAVLTPVGDLAAQAIQGGEFDWKRTAFRTAWSTAYSAPAGHWWHKKLDKLVPGGGTRAAAKKVAIDQLAWSPANGALFFVSYDMIVRGKSFGQAAESTAEVLPKDMAAGAAVWPAVNFYAFKKVPIDVRPLFQKTIGLGYGVAWSVLFLDKDKQRKDDPTPGEEADEEQPEDGLPSSPARDVVAKPEPAQPKPDPQTKAPVSDRLPTIGGPVVSDPRPGGTTIGDELPTSAAGNAETPAEQGGASTFFKRLNDTRSK